MSTPKSLAGIRILDLSRVLAAPCATQLLGDLGAEVIKIERPGSGDDTRAWGPPFVADADGEPTELSAYFLSANRNKRSVAVDIATPAGVEVIKRLAAVCDVVIENYKPGDLARRGLAYEDLVKVRPDLVWASVTGFGRTGPYSDRVGYDFLVQGMGGIMSITGEPDGAPMKVGVGISDIMCGMYAAVGILAALRHRDATGEGQFFEVSLYDTQLSWLVYAATNYLVSGRAPRRLGNRHPNIAPYQTYAASDGHLIVAVGNDGQFRRFCATIGRPDLADDPRFANNSARLANVDAMEVEVGARIATARVDQWVERLTAVNVPCGPVASVDRALEDPHTLAREMLIAMDNPAGGEALRLLGNPLKFERTPVSYERPPPRLNADAGEVLEGVLGLSPAEVARLAAGGAFGQPE